MKLNLNQIELVFAVSEAIDLKGISNKEIDDLIDFQDDVKKKIDRFNKQVEKIYKSEGVEWSIEAFETLSPEKQKSLVARLDALDLPEVNPIKIFDSETITAASRQYGLGAIRLSREIFMKEEVKEEEE